MTMNPRTHPRGAAPDFTLPHPNPNPDRMTDALWWLVCMRELLEPASQNGGTYANKPGYHNVGNNLPDHGAGNAKTDHSIRWPWDRRGPWWRTKTAGHDWTFPDAQHGNYATIKKYSLRQVNAMRDPRDLRPDDVYAYVLGQTDNDTSVEGWNERTDAPDSSSDTTHLWHIHDSFRRDIVGNFWAMWKVLTIDMGWTYAEWLKSTEPEEETPVTQPITADEILSLTATAGKELFEPDRPAGSEVGEDTMLMLSAIWAKRAFEKAEENAAALARIEALLAPEAPAPQDS